MIIILIFRTNCKMLMKIIIRFDIMKPAKRILVFSVQYATSLIVTMFNGKSGHIELRLFNV